jgi:hypothetical protein
VVGGPLRDRDCVASGVIEVSGIWVVDLREVRGRTLEVADPVGVLRVFGVSRPRSSAYRPPRPPLPRPPGTKRRRFLGGSEPPKESEPLTWLRGRTARRVLLRGVVLAAAAMARALDAPTIFVYSGLDARETAMEMEQTWRSM